MNRLITLKADKFKNNAIGIILPVDIDEKITDYNLIAAILKRGCKKYPTTKSISSYLQDNYGAVFDIIVSKRGEKLLLNFYTQFIDNRYAIFNEDILGNILDFLKNFIQEPLINEGKFNEEYFDQEVKNLRILVESRINDKDQYVIDRAEELCCSKEPYSRYKYGDIDRLKNINNKDLTELWTETLKKNNFYFLTCGNIDEDKFRDIINEKFDNLLKKDKIIAHNNTTINDEVDFCNLKEKMNVNQGKLAMCFKTSTNILNGDYFALAIMNSILGGGTHSKLFNIVREKNSLAYYCYSFIEKFKGLMTITAGIDSSNYEKAKNLIIDIIENIKKGDITSKELEYAKRKTVNDIKAVSDSEYSNIDYIGALRTYGILYSIDEIINGMEKVTLDRVIEVSHKLKLGSIYFIEN